MSCVAFAPFILLTVALDAVAFAGPEWLVGTAVFLLVPLAIWAITSCWWLLAGVQSAEISRAAKAAFVALLVGSILWCTYRALLALPMYDTGFIAAIVALAMLPPLAIIAINRFVHFEDALSKKLMLHIAVLCWIVFSAFPMITEPDL